MKRWVCLFSAALFCIPLCAAAVDDELLQMTQSLPGNTGATNPDRTAALDQLDTIYEQLRQDADDAKAREQSTANKLIGAAGIGLTGAGLRNTMEGMAEMQLDENTTQSMKAYLQTFRCNYGGGSSYKGGEENIELPGAGALMPLVTEYKTLASELKEMKLALDMKPGIESQEILDSATMGLHDDVRHGIESGAFTSVSRALLNENGEDAAAWAKQGTDAKHKRNTGAGMAAVGAVGSAVASGIVNRPNNATGAKK